MKNSLFSIWMARLPKAKRFDVYYGIAENRIGVARLDLPDSLPPRGCADPPGAKV
jgi:hypothetical protein